MHITYLLHNFPMPSETFITDEAIGLLDLGYDVHIATKRLGNAVLSAEQAGKLNNRVSVLNKNDATKAILRGLWTLFWRLAFKPSQWLWASWLLIRAPKMLLHIAVFSQLIKQTHQQKTDVYIAHFASMGLIAAMLKKLGYFKDSERLIIVTHGNDVSALPRKLGYGIFRAYFSQQGIQTITIAASWKPTLKKMGVPEAHVRYLGINPKTFNFQPRKLPKNRPIRFLSVGRLVAKKGYLVTLEALAKLPSNLKWEYHIIGGGPLQQAIQDAIQRLNLSSHITLYGTQSVAEVKKHITAADAFILASHTAANGDSEGIPVALMEALAGGLPVISTRHSGIPELIIHEKTGLLADENNVADLTQQLQRLCTTPKLWDTLTLSGLKHVSENFNQQKNLASFAKRFL